MEAVVKMWGNSLGLRFPKAMLDSYAISDGTKVNIEAKRDGILIKKADNKVTLESLFDGYVDDYYPKEETLDENIGNEVW